ncbi:MAG: RNA polymerase sigma factor YlaC [Phycisphaerae bacterium]|nr:RNA polymerase sigma factor YlaC [Phycisphaerae bacterium]
MVSLESLYRSHASAILAYLRRTLRAGDGAEDLLQETFVQAVRRPDQLAGVSSPRAWLFGIARHVGLSALRRRRADERLVTEPPAEAEGGARLEAVREAIEGLPETQREALELRLRDGLSYQEIADVQGVPVGTVRSRLHHAMRRLREMVQADE